jgi:hypothetical protein
MAAFSYRRNPFTPAQYQEMLDRLATMFFKWWFSRPMYEGQPRERVFKFWWMYKGPTGFAGSEDRLRFKQELWNHIQQITDETRRTEDSGQSGI